MSDATADHLERYHTDAQGEIDGVTVYRAMAAGADDPKLREL